MSIFSDYHGDPPDYDYEEVARLHCKLCGSFLPAKPESFAPFTMIAHCDGVPHRYGEMQESTCGRSVRHEPHVFNVDTGSDEIRTCPKCHTENLHGI